jgi:hypothetical protein
VAINKTVAITATAEEADVLYFRFHEAGARALSDGLDIPNALAI